MRFDRTKGMKARYIVTLYGWNVQDHYYFHYLKEAKELFGKLNNGKHDKGTIISLSDLVKDKRLAFVEC